MLTFLYGMLAGYMVASINVALIILKKGYVSLNDIPENKETIQ